MPSRAVSESFTASFIEFFWLFLFMGILSIESHIRGWWTGRRIPYEDILFVSNDDTKENWCRVFIDYRGGYLMGALPELLTLVIYIQASSSFVQAALLSIKITLFESSTEALNKFLSSFDKYESYFYPTLLFVALSLYCGVRYGGLFRRI